MPFSFLAMVTLKAKNMKNSETKQLTAGNSQCRKTPPQQQQGIWIGSTECGILNYTIAAHELEILSHQRGRLNIILRIISLSKAGCPSSHKCFLIRIT